MKSVTSQPRDAYHMFDKMTMASLHVFELSKVTSIVSRIELNNSLTNHVSNGIFSMDFTCSKNSWGVVFCESGGANQVRAVARWMVRSVTVWNLSRLGFVGLDSDCYEPGGANRWKRAVATN
ncbi:hypothetical protein V2J09_003730 [Rumex salicifolius]